MVKAIVSVLPCRRVETYRPISHRWRRERCRHSDEIAPKKQRNARINIVNIYNRSSFCSTAVLYFFLPSSEHVCSNLPSYHQELLVTIQSLTDFCSWFLFANFLFVQVQCTKLSSLSVIQAFQGRRQVIYQVIYLEWYSQVLSSVFAYKGIQNSQWHWDEVAGIGPPYLPITSHLIISRIFTLYNYFIVLFKIAFILIQPLAARTTINVCVCVCVSQ